MSGEIDVVADSVDRFQRRLSEGDDLAQWTVRFGCVLHDPHRIFRSAYARILRQGLWPDPRRKFERANALASLARQVLTIEDREAGQEHIRAGLTSLARGLLLAQGVFPLARSELATQLADCRQAELAEWLGRSIHEDLSLAELHDAVRLLQASGADARRWSNLDDVADAA